MDVDLPKSGDVKFATGTAKLFRLKTLNTLAWKLNDECSVTLNDLARLISTPAKPGPMTELRPIGALHHLPLLTEAGQW